MDAICGGPLSEAKKVISGGSLVNDFIQNVQVLVWMFWFTQCKHYVANFGPQVLGCTARRADQYCTITILTKSHTAVNIEHGVTNTG